MKKFLPLITAVLLLLPISAAVAEPQESIVQTGDIDRFWQAYDAVRAAGDTPARLELLQRLYLDPATPGLRALMAARRYTLPEYVEAIEQYPRFWNSIRPLTARATEAAASLENDIAALRRVYPELKPASITYAIGILRTGGTTTGNMVLIGAEIALSDETVDVSELREPLRTRLGAYFKTRPFANNSQNNVHEYVHTQQQESADTLAARVVYEGVAEFVAELATGNRAPLALYVYGPAHRDEVRRRFKADMDVTDWRDWLYNSDRNVFGVSDMGYFVGYEIAKHYYDQATDKRAAVRAMIELAYGDAKADRKSVV